MADKKPMKRPTDIRTMLGAIYNARDLSNLDKFIKDVAQVESSGGKNTVSKESSARGIYQFLTEGEGNAFQTGLNRTAAMYGKMGSIPEWVIKAKEHNDPNKLSKKQQEDVMLANLYQQVGTDEYFTGVLEGDSKAASQLYEQFHHTTKGITEDERIADIFGIVKRQQGGPVEAGQPYLVGEQGPELIVPNQSGMVLPNQDPKVQQRIEAIDASVQAPLPIPKGYYSGADAVYIGPREEESIKPTRKVKYITFDNPNVRIPVPAEFDDTQTKEYLKSGEAENYMMSQGYLWRYGLEPTQLDDPTNLDDWDVTAGMKTGYDNLKAIGAGALYTFWDIFDNEEKKKEFERLIDQYNQDAFAHLVKPGEDGGLKIREGESIPADLRITQFSDLFNEAKLGRFIDWAQFNFASGATTMVPMILASLAGAAAGVAAAPFTGGTSLAATGALIAGTGAAYVMGVGEITGAQLDRYGDSNAALSLGGAVPYAVAERYLGAGNIIGRTLLEKYGKESIKKVIAGTTIKKTFETKLNNSLIKEVAKGFGSNFVGEGATEAIQEVISSTAAELGAGASLGDLYKSKDFWVQIGNAAAAGAVAGGGIGMAIGGPMNYIGKIGLKNIDATITTAERINRSNVEAVKSTGAAIDDIVTITGELGDKEYKLLGTQILSDGEEHFILQSLDGTGNVSTPIKNASKLRKSRLTEADKATLEDGATYMPEDTTPIPKAKEANQAVRDLKARGIINSEQTVEDLIGIAPDTASFIEEEWEEYQAELKNREELILAGEIPAPLPAKYKKYFGLEGEAFAKAAAEQYQREKKQGIVDFTNTTLANENQLTDEEKLALQKLGYYKGPRGMEFINRLLSDTYVKDKAKETNGLRKIREIIANQTAYVPQSLETNRVVSRTQVPPLLPNELTGYQPTPEQEAEGEALTQAKKLYDWNIAKADEQIVQLQSELADLSALPQSPLRNQEIIQKTNEIANLETRKHEIAKTLSDPVSRIIAIRDIVNNMDNSGFKVNMIQYYRQALKEARKAKDEVLIQYYQNEIKNYVPTKQHVFTFNGKLVYTLTSKAKQQLEADVRALEEVMKELLPGGFTIAGYRTLTEKQRLRYRQVNRTVQQRRNAIKNIDNKRDELNALLESFDIEPIVKWDSFSNKPRIPELNKIKKKLFGYEEIKREKVIEQYWSLKENPDSNDRPALTEETINKLPMLLESLNAELSRMGLDNLSVRIISDLVNAKGAQVNGRFLGGMNLIEVALNAVQNASGNKLNPSDSRMFTLHHESMHYVFRNLLTEREQKVLMDAARKAYLKKYNIKKRYEGYGLSEQQLLEEAISDAFADYMATTANGSVYSPKGMIARIFDRIRNYIIALGNVLTGAQLRQTAQIFNNIDMGVMKARQEIMDKIDISQTEMLNLASIAGISESEAYNFFYQRGRSVVTVGGEKVGSSISNADMYRSWVMQVVPKIIYIQENHISEKVTRSVLENISNLIQNLTTESGVPNLEQANFYLQRLNGLSERDLNTMAAFLQSNIGARLNLKLIGDLKASMPSRVTEHAVRLLELLDNPAFFAARLNTLNKNMPTETDIRIAGSPHIVFHGTDPKIAKDITKKGFKIAPGIGDDSLGVHFGTMSQASIISMKKYGNVEMLPAILHIVDPVRMKDMGANWGANRALNALTMEIKDTNLEYGLDVDMGRPTTPGLIIDKIFTQEEARIIRDKFQDIVAKAFRKYTPTEVQKLERNQEVRYEQQKILIDAIKDKGYDGIVYRNVYEVTEEPGIETKDSFIAFDSNQIMLVDNNSNLDMSDISYSAATTVEPDPSDDSLSEPVEATRHELRLDEKGIEESGKAADKVTDLKDGETINLKDLGRAEKMMMHFRGIALRYPFLSKLWRLVTGMEQKARGIQMQFAAQMRRYYDIINRVEGAKEALAKAHIISQQEGAQAKYTKDEQGRIIFVSPKSLISGGNNPITINQGEVVVLEGAVADVYMEAQAAIETVLKEHMKGTIASSFIPQLKSAIRILTEYNPEILVSAGIDPATVTDNDIENFEFNEVNAIVQGLIATPQIIRNKAMDASLMNSVNLSNLALSVGEITNSIGVLLGGTETNLNTLLKQTEQFEQFKKFDYVPLQRYGTHAITVTDKEGKVLRYEHIEKTLVEEKARGFTNARKFADVRSRLIREYPPSEGYTVSEVEEINNEVRNRLPKDLSMLDNMAQRLSDRNAEGYRQAREELDSIIGKGNLIGFDQFLRGRKEIGGVPGFDGDILRSISQFGMVGSEYAARNRFLKDIKNSYTEAINYADKNNLVRLKDTITKMKEYGVDNSHNHEWATMRRMGFWWFLGGNISSGILQTMSIVQFTGPMLAEFSNSAAAATELSRAFADVSRLGSWSDNEYNDVWLKLDRNSLMKVFKDKQLVEAIIEDVGNGIIKQGQALFESGQAPGYQIIPTDKTTQQARARLKIMEQQIMGGTFNTMETFSRLVAYVAAYRTVSNPTSGTISNPAKNMQRADDWYSGSNLIWGEMKKQRGGIATAQDLARILIDDTFGDYSKANRPRMMRNFGSVVFLFQTYISQMFGLLRRLLVGQGNAQQRAMGRRIFARIILQLFLTAGLFGLPGFDDLDFLYRMIMKMGGVNDDLRTQMREVLTDVGVGAKMTEAIMNGGIESFGNISVQRRLSLGEVPGSAQMRAMLSMLGVPTGAKAEQFLGAPGAIMFGIPSELNRMIQQQGGKAFSDMDFYMATMPSFVKNLYRAAYKYPAEGYVETRNGTLLTTDVKAHELMLQGIGFTPTEISKAREILWYEKQIDTKYQGRTKRFNAQIKKAYRDLYMAINLINDPALGIEAQQRLQETMREIIEFNNTVDSPYTYVPDLNRLRDEGIQQANSEYRAFKSDKATYLKKQDMYKQMGVN